MNRVALLIFFLVVNFGGLAIGSWLMNSGPGSSWYLELNKAPWTPPGWVFGVAWTLIMICFSIYLAFLFSKEKSTEKRWIFILALIFNVSWNYIFFNQQLTAWALVNIIILTVLIFYFFFRFNTDKLRIYRLLLLPYMIWLCLATSLNAYIVFNN
ncbi:MAG: tryptophan-rich sensory protein [Flavobacteriaceae bacterium]|nr:tryptophan-rich sensory protein [Bacteroidia bacterium]NNK88510.1 tryptophan-rich sensory protein [Flavobacteriaceae bacterium]